MIRGEQESRESLSAEDVDNQIEGTGVAEEN
jgi:hypothetical protein